MPQSFGARLRQRREDQAIALSTIAEQTKIKLSLLDALERDDVSQWPSGIFRRAFIRAYAHAIGLNPDDVVREFLEVHPEPAEVMPAVEAVAARLDDGRPNSAPPTRLRYIMGSAIGSLTRLRRPASADGDAGVSEPVRVQRTTDSALRVVLDDAPRPMVAAPSSDPEPPAVAAASQVASEAVAAAAEAARPVPAVPMEVATPPPAPAPAPLETKTAAPPVPGPKPEPTFKLDLAAVARLCTELGRVDNADDLQQVLRGAAEVMDATGLIVWLWDGIASELRPALAHGYSDRVLAQLPPVTPNADNATAAAFRAAQPRAINGNDREAGALAVPLLTPSGCGGVLAIELQHGREQMASVRCVATILAAMLAQLVASAQPAETAAHVDAAESLHARRHYHQV